MRFGTRNVRYRQGAGSKIAVGRELLMYRFDLVGIYEVIWDKGGTKQAEDCTIFCGTWNKNCQLETVT